MKTLNALIYNHVLGSAKVQPIKRLFTASILLERTLQFLHCQVASSIAIVHKFKYLPPHFVNMTVSAVTSNLLVLSNIISYAKCSLLNTTKGLVLSY